MCIIYVVPDGCEKPRTLKCLVTPSLEEEEILLGWSDMVQWRILKKDFHIMQDEDEEEMEKSADVRKCTSNLIPSRAIGGGGISK